MSLSRRAQENLVAGILLAVFVAFAAISLTYGDRARLVPLPVAIASSLLILLQLYLQNTRADADLAVDAMHLFARQGEQITSTLEAELAIPEQGVTIVEEPGGSEWSAALLVIAFVSMILLVGILPAVFLFVFGYFLLVSKKRVLTSLAYAIGTEVAIYALFVWVLKVQMYGGWLIELLG